jgi:hypothetical protein
LGDGEGAAQRFSGSLRVRARVEQGVGGFDLEGGGGETLGDGVVELACQPVALLYRAELGTPGEESGPLDGDAQEVAYRVEQLQVFW